MRSIPIPEKAGAPLSVFRNASMFKEHPDFGAAKGGDPKAAIRFVKDMVTPEYVEALRGRFGPGCVFVSPGAIEASGINQIPSALAAFCASVTGGSVSVDVVQMNKVYHTGATAVERLLYQPVFSGRVEAGAKHVVVDDVTTMGGTLSGVADHIQKGGGQVVGLVVLADASRSATIHPKTEHVREIEKRYGDAIRETFNIDPVALTSSEATCIIACRDVDALRAVVAKAEASRRQRLGAKGVREPEQRNQVLGREGKPPATKSRVASLREKREKSNQNDKGR